MAMKINMIKTIMILFLCLICIGFLGYTRLSVFHPELCPRNYSRNFSGYLCESFPIDDPDNFTVALMGDCRGNIEAMEQVILDAKTRSDFAFINGDLVHEGGQRQFRYFLHELHEVQGDYPVFTLIGNHDLVRGAKNKHELYEEIFGPQHYWMICGKTLFVALNNVEKEVWKDELNWLDGVLEQRGKEAKLVFLLMHKQPFVEYANGKIHKPLSLNKTRELMDIVHRYPVNVIFAAHIHGYLHYKYEGVPVYVSGEAGAFQHGETQNYGYLLLRVRNGEAYEVEHVQQGNIFNWDHLEYLAVVKGYHLWPWLSLGFMCLAFWHIRARGGKG